MGLITDFAQVKQSEEDEKPLTRGELKQILSGLPVAAMMQQTNAVARELNNIGFRFNTLIDFLMVHGMRKGSDTRYRLDGQAWTKFFQDAVKKQNEEVERKNLEARRKAEEQAAKPN